MRLNWVTQFIYKTKSEKPITSKSKVFIYSKDGDTLHEDHSMLKYKINKGSINIIDDAEMEFNIEDDIDVIVEKLSDNGKTTIIKNKTYEVITEDEDNIEVIIDDMGNKTIKKEVIVIDENNDRSKIIFTGKDDKNLLFIVDGKTHTKSEFEDIDMGKIETINVIKGEKAIEKYGSKAKDGAIIITTKE